MGVTDSFLMHHIQASKVNNKRLNDKAWVDGAGLLSAYEKTLKGEARLGNHRGGGRGGQTLHQQPY